MQVPGTVIVQLQRAMLLVLCLSLHSCAKINTAHSLRVELDNVESWRTLGDIAWRHDADGFEAGPSDGTGFLVSNDTFTDFRLSVEFWIADDTNSGIFIRCPNPNVVADLTPLNCYEVNIWDNHPNQSFRTGSIVTRAEPAVRVDSVGHWNTYRIEMRGSTLTVTLNGQQTALLVDDSLQSGYLALQYAKGGLLRFRKLMIEPL